MQDDITSIKYGLCKAMSEYGFSPSQLEELLSNKEAMDKVALDPKKLNPLGILSPVFTIALGGGALAGVGTAALRHKIDQIGKGTEDRDMRKNRMRVEMYKKMISDLKNDIAASSQHQ
jgi:hypothetical protein